MINPNELRLGNLVQYANDTYTDREDKIGNGIFRVCLIAENVIKVDIGYGARQRFEKNPIVSPEMSELAPIALTEDWLERFGLNLVEDLIDMKYYQKSDERHGYGICLNHDEWEFYKFSMFKDETRAEVLIHSECHFQHIHQLQNIWKDLTGEELQLKPIAQQ